jgi:glutamyl-tRNA reductase
MFTIGIFTTHITLHRFCGVLCLFSVFLAVNKASSGEIQWGENNLVFEITRPDETFNTIMVGLTGISYKTSAVDVREQFSLSKEEIIPFSELLQKETDISEIVVLSTCNRTEIYFSQDKYDFQLAAKLVYKTLKHFKGIESKHWHSFYSYANDEAVRHLFEVASGIDSMVIGEDQIIGQIKDAYMFCTEAALTDAVLMRLFQKSFEAGKRVRTETKIKMGTTSISSAAVQKCSRLFENLSDKRVLLIGAGETGSLVLQNFNKNGNPKITVTNRTGKSRKAGCKA